MKAFGTLAIALAAGGGLFIALILAEASAPGLDLGPVKWVLPMVVGSGVFAGLNAQAGNRRVTLADATRKAALLGFASMPGHGWVVVMRDRSNAAAKIGFDVAMDGTVIAQLLPKRFTMLALPVGPHLVFADIPGAPGPSAVAPLEIAVAEGCITIFAIRTSMGLMRTSPRLEPVADTPQTRATLGRMRMVEPEPASS